MEGTVSAADEYVIARPQAPPDDLSDRDLAVAALRRALHNDPTPREAARLTRELRLLGADRPPEGAA